MKHTLFDYHTHTSFSDDSEADIEEMISAAYEKGLSEIAVTDHYDPGYPDKNFPFDLDFEKYDNTLSEIKEFYKDKILIKKGIEIGLQPAEIERCIKASDALNYDFIIASIHCSNGETLYDGRFFNGRTVKQSYLDFYENTYNCIKMFDNFCVLGHLNIIDRYAPEIADTSVYSDIVDEIFRHLIENGKGIEINTSSHRYNMNDTIPQEFFLKRYLELGGEIITTGSDAHQPEDIAFGFENTYEYLSHLGFRYVTIFNARKPEFIKL